MCTVENESEKTVNKRDVTDMSDFFFRLKTRKLDSFLGHFV